MDNNISVALATYNGSLYLEEQLLSIFNQTQLPKEVIIVDDLSTDNTIEIIEHFQKSYSFIHLFVNEKNVGPIKSFQKAISKSNYEYIALCDQDDIWDKNKLELCLCEIKKIQKGNSPTIVFTDLKMIDSTGNILRDSFWNVHRYRPTNFQFKELLIGNFVTGCTILMDKNMKNEISSMPDVIVMHDYWMALIVFGFGNYKALNCTTMRYRVHSNSVTNKSRIGILVRIRMFLSVFFDFDREYLSANILQAELFLKMYESKIDVKKVNQLNKLIKLKNKSSFMRKLYVAYLKYLSF
jgi:glycosyltransferase involved in cell wall biosynthesis